MDGDKRRKEIMELLKYRKRSIVRYKPCKETWCQQTGNRTRYRTSACNE